MINTVLFDLDGTIVSIDNDTFINEFIKSVSSKITKIMNSKLFIKFIYESTMDMINNLDEKITNKNAFYKSFFNKIDIAPDKIINIFDDFYMNEYTYLKNFIKPNASMRKAIGLLKNKGYEIILATNPVFPLTALEKRSEWAGVSPETYGFITSYETMHFCKPYKHYYSEILDRLNKKPSECLMVGNDVDEDMVSADLGIDTFLLTDHLINKNKADINRYKNGKYDELYKYVTSLPAL